METTVYLLIQTSNLEMIAAEAYRSKDKAEKAFETIMEEDSLLEPEEDWIFNELVGTFRIAGDDASCVQLIERTCHS